MIARLHGAVNRVWTKAAKGSVVVIHAGRRRRRHGMGTAQAIRTVPDDTSTAESLGFLHEMVASGRFCRDTPLGGALHRGSTSYREVSDGDSLHVSIDEGRVSVHVDHFSPVAGTRDDGCCTYSVRAVLAHLRAYLAAQARQLVHGARGRHRCRLECDMVDVEEVDGGVEVRCAGEDQPPVSTEASAACTASSSDRWTRSSAV